MTIDRNTWDSWCTDPAAFRDELRIDVDGTVRRFGDVQDPWQRADFKAMDGGLLRCMGRNTDTEAQTRAYLERGRGHSKTTDLAVLSVTALTFATRPLRGYCFAADKDQAKLLRDAVQTILRLNPWIGDILTVGTHTVTNNAAGDPGEGGSLSIEASDVGSSYGILPDLIIADELVHWMENAEPLWHSLLSSAAKRSNCLLCVISNAGFVDSWQWSVREAARQDPNWIFSRLDGPQASWLTSDRLDEQRRMLPHIAFARLWLNQWSSGGGDALTEADILAAFDTTLTPMTTRQPGFVYVAGVDLSLTRDCSAVVVLAVPDGGRAGKIRLAHHRLWRPTAGTKIDLTGVESHILKLDSTFRLDAVVADPWQAESMIQRLEQYSERRRRSARKRFGSEPWARAIPPTATNLRAQCTLTIEGFQDRRFSLFPCEALKRDLLKLRVEEKTYGLRLVSPRDGEGHGDTASAFALALQVAHSVQGARPAKAGAVIADTLRRDLLEDNLAELRRRQSEFSEFRPYSTEDENTEAMRHAMGDLQRNMARAYRHGGFQQSTAIHNPSSMQTYRDSAPVIPDVVRENLERRGG